MGDYFATNKNIFKKILTRCKKYAKIKSLNDDRLIENEITQCKKEGRIKRRANLKEYKKHKKIKSNN